MIKQILAFFETPAAPVETLTADECAAVLLIEVMLADDDLDTREKECIAQLLANRMSVSLQEAEDCLAQALIKNESSTDLHQFVRVVNELYSEEDRYRLLVDLWRVAFADGRLDKYEDHRIRRLAEFMHLHHSHFIRAKQEAQSAS